MNDVIRSLMADSRDELVLALDIFSKATILLVLAWFLHALAGQKRALLRSALWNACLVGLLLVPLACLVFPRMKLQVLPSSANRAAMTQDVIRTAASPVSVNFETPRDFESIRPPAFDRTDSKAPPESGSRNAKVDAIQERPAIEERSKWRPDGLFIAIGLYLAIVVLHLLRLTISLRTVWRLERYCIPLAVPEWVEGLARNRERLGIGRHVRLMQSGRISVPIVVGWLRPAVILPASLAGSEASGLIDAVLVHELAHVRRGDYIWNVVSRIVQAIYWLHPLVWPLGRVIGSVREQACDDLCVHVLGGPDGYHDSLVEVASGLVRRPEPALGMAMARSTALARRIAWIHRTRGSADCILPRPARLTLVFAILSIAGLIGSIELARASADPVRQEPKVEKAEIKEQTKSDSKPESKSELPESIDITVLAQDTGKPLANVAISAFVDRKIEELHTDKAGKARIDLAGRTFLDILSFDVFVEGYVQQRFAYSKYESDKPPLPAQLQVNLWPGEETLGGKVVDEQGRPVEGVKVEIWGNVGGKNDPHELVYMIAAKTDALGQWRCRSTRKMTWAYLYLSHPDFLADTDQNPRVHGRIDANGEPTPNEQPFQGLRDFTDVEVLKKGIRISGRVVDDAGKPVGGAEVGWIRLAGHYNLQLDVRKAIADADGRFELPQTRPGQVVLQFKAPGHATELKIVNAQDGLEPLAVKLGRPYSMTGRVVDSKGAPIAGCEVLVDAWGGYGGPGFYLMTDNEGRFRWDEAPSDGLQLRIGREGFESISRHRVNPSEGEAIVTLRRALRVKGSILDAESGRRIMEPAEIEVGTRDAATGQIVWSSGSRFEYQGGTIRVTASRGEFQASLDAEALPEYRLRVRIRDYRPFETRVFRSDEGQVQYDIRMTKGSDAQGVAVSGVVRRPDGKPLEGADVAVAYDTYTKRRLPEVRVVDGKIERVRDQVVVKTDADGRFALTRAADADAQACSLIIVHPDFYAEVPRAAFEADPVIVARPWGRVEGVARLGSGMAKSAAIHYYGDHVLNPGVPVVFVSGKVQTDAEGKFVIERVPPGDTRVNRIFEDVSKSSRWVAMTIVKVKPGETARVELGGKGRPVIARIERPAGFDPGLDYAANSECLIVSDRPRTPYPKEILTRRDNSMSEWHDRWWNSPEGFEYRKNWLQFGLASLRPDGTIRFEEVPPGDYELQLTYSGEPLFGQRIDSSQVGYAKLKFTVPEIPGGYSDEPLDLGTLKPMPKPVLEVGQAVPEFDVETLDGKRAKLADLRGKFVLLDFWATWCGPCVDEIPEMKSVFERYGKDDRFAMVSLSLDAEKEAPRKFVADKAIGWPQGWLGEWAERGVQDAYHVEAIPAVFLIGPDGKLVAKGLRGKEMAGAVARALGGP